jgi:5-methyltetrahydropteroyltriglutamate--homocysteine methyltransferase
MPIPTEPIGSVPRPPDLLAAMRARQGFPTSSFVPPNTRLCATRLAAWKKLARPVITDGEQTKPSFATYPLTGLGNLAADGVIIPFVDGHTRQLPRLTAGPFTMGFMPPLTSRLLSATRTGQLSKL